MRDQPGRDGEDVSGRAIIALQPDDGRAGKIMFESQDIVDLGASPTVDGLIVVADAADVPVHLRQQPEPQVLHDIGVLILVH